MAKSKEDAVQRVQRVRDSFLTLGDYALGLPEKAKNILKLLGAGNCARDVAKTIPCSKSNVSYWKNKFLNIGALRLVVKDIFKEYALTPYGSKILTTSESGVPDEVCCLEDYAVKFGVLDWGQADRLDWRKLGRPRNWEKLGVKIGLVRVVRTPSNVIIHPGKLRGFDEDELLMFSGRIVERVKMVLENNFGMVLGDDGKPLHEPITRFYSKEAKELVRKYGTTVVEEVGSIDNSPPERIPHEEYKGRNLAKERLMMPLRIPELRKEVDELKRKVDDFGAKVDAVIDGLATTNGNLVKLVDALNGNGAHLSPQSSVEPRYIS